MENTAANRLAHVLSSAYEARILKRDLGANPHELFAQHATEHPDFLDAAQAEYDRLEQLAGSLGCPLEQRCFASARHFEFLKEALLRVKSNATGSGQ